MKSPSPEKTLPHPATEPFALRLCQYKAGRVLLHICAAVRQPRNWRWHARGLLRDFTKAPASRTAKGSISVEPDSNNPQPKEL